MVIKISKLHQRLQGRGKPVVAITTPIPALPVSDVPQGRHIIWMSREAAYSFDMTGYAVISIGDASRTPEQYPIWDNCLGTLYLNFNPTGEGSGWINTEHRKALSAFVRQHDGKNFVVHCTYGQLRSKGVAAGLRNAFEDDGECSLYNTFKTSRGTRTVLVTGDTLYEDGLDERAKHAAYSAAVRDYSKIKSSDG